ncbi:DUF1206 domain-containing protein [Pleurocapsa sp. PCC 7319]|uniref:DUF1206 domain-containing protein n=1 Tax=Pleurocapsa sp. PCC 7319 TaxID=118161 RepID=UPI00034A2EEE|nr:DUF1206 domain-containing protein [Pleurocapsa sp. PCC 7319]
METFARFGYTAKGFVYSAIGILALLAAFGIGGETTDTTGALEEIATQPFGKILLALIAFGLVGYVMWRLVQAINDPQNKGTDAKGIITRLGYVLSGVSYAGVAANAALLAIGSSNSGSGGNSKQDWTAMVMEQPLGRWLVGLVGAVVIGIGFWRLYEAYKIKFRKKLDLSELSWQYKDWLINICRFGIAARGVVFIMIGFFVLQAAHQFNPNKVKGLDGALLTLTQQPYGKVLLALMALGLIAYAVSLLVQARYGRIKIN